ncbi:hypothetical protein N7510_005327 [Penicillium lagena]|uniref:uncharacterized protein n=1 Tax=Penicillium lagena TaxID=94218 RepID=UPI00254199BC|nr:uncharacterized protein N7510_005327 [Penicillium lagena]KAJ5612133.1 hypothetical protein N7510_005327 [Penicillium lagena]
MASLGATVVGGRVQRRGAVERDAATGGGRGEAQAHSGGCRCAVTGTALAVPTTRGDKVVTISGLSASQNDQMGFITFNLNDPNYHDQTIANVIWDRPGNPQEKATTNDLAYHVHFPDGVKDISAFDFQLQRVNSTEKISVSVNDNRNSCTQATKWICGTATARANPAGDRVPTTRPSSTTKFTRSVWPGLVAGLSKKIGTRIDDPSPDLSQNVASLGATVVGGQVQRRGQLGETLPQAVDEVRRKRTVAVVDVQVRPEGYSAALGKAD